MPIEISKAYTLKEIRPERVVVTVERGGATNIDIFSMTLASDGTVVSQGDHYAVPDAAAALTELGGVSPKALLDLADKILQGENGGTIKAQVLTTTQGGKL